VSVCPTTALAAASSDDAFTLSFTPSACTNCALCTEACPEKAVDFEPEVRLTDLLDEQPRLLATVTPSWCAACGDLITGHRGALCPTCERRQASLPYLRRAAETAAERVSP
jgi:ferredoxin